VRLCSPAFLFATAGLALLLAGCAGQGLFSEPGSPSTVSSEGGYKVGRPYKINGRWYYPKEDFGYREVGVASWYGPGFHGRRTARGDVYDQYAMTAAHRTLPMPSLVRVTNLENGREADLLVNDRGPFVGDRIIDVSKRAAQELGFQTKGTARVRVRVLERESRELKQAAIGGGRINTPSGGGRQVATAGAPSVAVTARIGGVALGYESGPAGDLTTGRIYVQAGAFSEIDRAERLRRHLSRLSDVSLSPVRVGGRELFRVRLGPVTSRSLAERMLTQVAAAGYPEARIVVD